MSQLQFQQRSRAPQRERRSTSLVFGSRTALGFLAIVTLLLFFPSSAHSDAGLPTSPRERFGVGATGSLEGYDLGRLRAGWYLSWGVEENPSHPVGMEHVQVVRLHQLTECWSNRLRNRDECPYIRIDGDYTYTLTSPSSRGEIVSIAEANPGALWLIGNEMDRYDWGIPDPDNPGEYLVPPGGQDEMLPELYAEAYHDLHQLITEADGTAEVAIGGVIQPTPLRLQYLDIVWETYRSLYGEAIPVDVWNIHNMILREYDCEYFNYDPNICYGADVPPGVPPPADGIGAHYEGEPYSIQDADNLDIFEHQIYAFRNWLASKGVADAPLIISEFSVLYGDVPGTLDFDLARVRAYLDGTVGFLTTEAHATLGYTLDDDRLVQRWAWYSLDDATFGGEESFHHLFDPDTKQITPLGQDYSDDVSALCHGTDVDCDCQVGLIDVQQVADRWRCAVGDACYYPWHDQDDSGVVTIIDVMKVVADWNWSCSP